MKKLLLGIVALVIIAAGAWWYWGMGTPAPVGTDQPGTVSTSTNTNMLSLGDSTVHDYVDGNLLLGADATSTLGKYIIGFNGMTLYTYTKDTPGATSTCTAQCAVNWPPYTVATTSYLANVQAGIHGAVGAHVRADGTLQVTYKGMPLYFFVKDMQSGDTTGQSVGGVWYVVTP